ncbi:MAG: U32 family peptidase [Bacteroidaceae bacterium]|nr:U32 family peptidase [Bacteroidaceae bacterium]
MSPRRPIELLSPARNLECGRAAILCGADAVYIGAQAYSARASAGNSVQDIQELAAFAHQYGARVYVALNTILYDNELDSARRLAHELAQAGADALITQDMALIDMQLPLPLHASTQMDNRTPQQVRFLQKCGFRQAILARELGTEEIAAIHQACPDMALEVFVHGALCVSLSGRCHASQYCFGRSANRGQCAQFCRLAFDLEDADGRVLLHDKHLLSLRDMNRSRHLEELMDAGVSSFKIEGRLKDIHYVKNITAYYRNAIDTVLERRSEYRRASYGHSQPGFEPNPLKSFNRGITNYFLHGRTHDLHSFDTPKSIGEPVGEVKDIRSNRIRVAGLASFSNGDGICYLDREGQLHGFRVNRVENNNILHPATPQPGLMPHTPLYRNADAAFQRLLEHTQPHRAIAVDIRLEDTAHGFRLTMQDEAGRTACAEWEADKLPARQPQADRQRTELAKLGDTPLRCRKAEILTQQDYFIPASLLGEWRRQVVALLLKQPLTAPIDAPRPRGDAHYPFGELDYRANVANKSALQFLLRHGATAAEPALETQTDAQAHDRPLLLMTCRYCLRHALGRCPHDGKDGSEQGESGRLSAANMPMRPKKASYAAQEADECGLKNFKHGPKLPSTGRKKSERTLQTDVSLEKWVEPLYLVLPDKRRFRLRFDCQKCQMLIYAAP